MVCCSQLALPLANVLFEVFKASGEIIQYYSEESGQWCLVDEFSSDLSVKVSLPGYQSKYYSIGTLPDKIRLLEQSLIGYQKKLWFYPGENVCVFVNAPEEFSGVLFRHGLKKERIFDFGIYPAQQQSTPDNHFVDQGLEWNESFSYQIPKNAKPGLYSVLLSSNNECFAIPFIVSSLKKQQSRLLVLASTNTWQSYNIWGGRSRYRNNEDSKTQDYISSYRLFYIRLVEWVIKFVPNGVIEWLKKIIGYHPPKWVFKKLTIKRPFTNCLLEGDDVYQPFTNHLAASEWRLLAWLEREGFSYDLISGFELHSNSEILSNYQCLILSSHCEYWTSQMYETVNKAHNENNLWLLNLSGNTLYRQIEFSEDGSSRCVSLSFRQHYTDETQLIGVRFSMGDYGTCAPYKIKLPEHWVFNNLPIHPDYPYFGEQSLLQNTIKKSQYYDPGRPGLENGLCGNGASGWETDKLSSTAPKDFKLLAKGINKGGGADMVIREAVDRRGGFFSASSITFAASLLIDSTASGLVTNVLNRALDD